MTTAVTATGNPDNRAQVAYTSASALGSALETVRSSRPGALEFEGRSKFHAAPSLQSLTSTLFRARTGGSRFISDDEWHDLEKARPFWPQPQLIEQCRVLRRPWGAGAPAQESHIILFDTRVLQTTGTNGTTKHALAVLLAFLDAVSEDCEIAFLTSPLLPALEPDISRRATVHWRPGLIGDVDVYVQLATISHASDPDNIDLLRAPWIRRISVFLDDIQGIYPEHFAGTEYLFWIHQLAIEKLRSSDVILTLGKTSSDEAKSLWSTLMPDENQPIFMTTSCVTSVPMTESSSPDLVPREVLVFGNYHPHKNLALAACAIGAAREVSAQQLRFTFLADLSVAQRNAITDVATQAAGSNQKEAIGFASGLSDADLSRRIRESAGVVIPSLHEGFSIPVIDVIGLGTPVLLSRIPAHQELLPDGPWFFDPTDVSSLEAALRELFRSGRDWVPLQRAGLAHNYDARTLPNAVREALHSVLERHPVLRTRRGAPEPSGRQREPSVRRAEPLTLVDLEQRDREFISAKLSLVDSDKITDVQLGKPRLFFTNEHDTIVAEFHSSFTWRVGKAVTAPLHWFKSLKAKR